MTIACIDLYNNLLDSVLLMQTNKRISPNQAESMRADLREAMWHSGNPDDTRNALGALALHYDLPMPVEAEIDPMNLPFDIPDCDELPTLKRPSSWYIEIAPADLCRTCGGSLTDGIVRCVCKKVAHL